MKSAGRQTLAVLLFGVIAGLPVFASSPRGLVGVAQGTGAIEINGQPFGGQASLFSGDQVLTGTGAPLTVISSPAERIRFEPNTSAQVAKQERGTVILLNSGSIDFQTAGATSAELPTGVSVRPAANEMTLARVDQLANGTAEVAVYKGAVEVSSAKENLTVSAGHTAIIDSTSTGQDNDQNNQKKKKKKVWALFLATGLNGGAIAAILANEQSHSITAIDP